MRKTRQFADVLSVVFGSVGPSFAKKGWLVLLWETMLLPIGFAIRAFGLLGSNTIPRWQGTLLLLGVLLVANLTESRLSMRLLLAETS